MTEGKDEKDLGFCTAASTAVEEVLAKLETLGGGKERVHSRK